MEAHLPHLPSREHLSSCFEACDTDSRTAESHACGHDLHTFSYLPKTAVILRTAAPWLDTDVGYPEKCAVCSPSSANGGGARPTKTEPKFDVKMGQFSTGYVVMTIR